MKFVINQNVNLRLKRSELGLEIIGVSQKPGKSQLSRADCRITHNCSDDKIAQENFNLDKCANHAYEALVADTSSTDECTERKLKTLCHLDDSSRDLKLFPIIHDTAKTMFCS